VVWIREASPGSSDSQVLARAQDENRILITFDKDFGELAFPGRIGVRVRTLHRLIDSNSGVPANERDFCLGLYFYNTSWNY
jgi:hypothetical protein